MSFGNHRRLLFPLALAAAVLVVRLTHAQPDTGLAIEYPLDDSVFPPEFPAPAFLWHDGELAVSAWQIDVVFAEGGNKIQVRSAGTPPNLGEIDPRAVSENNRPPVLHAGLHSWTPDESLWSEIKRRSVDGPATVTIARAGSPGARASIRLTTSRDAVGAPIFYRDVPLMPSEVQQGVIKPLAPAGIPLIAWRLRDVAQPRSRLLLEGLHSCTNCHSFSRDGKTLAMDLDGPENDKGTYAIVAVAPRVTIRTEDVITWNDFRGKPAGGRTIGFLSQISPDGRYAVTTVNEEVYVANFKDYRFLQVFYPTRGILAIYDRTTKKIASLPGADDPRYVQTDAVWSPDGSYLVFARARARDAYPPGQKMAEFANDRAELSIQYDLYRVPFNEGRGGKAEAIAGASENGMSNTFPKISPDGRRIVFVRCRNGQLMRPDSELYIVPAEGGKARRMRANTPRMNSWHSFSPNGRWLVFSSKGRTPYTQMFLTHLDEQGNDSPAILIENATAANRAVNLPEFVNVGADGLLRIDAPASAFYTLFDNAADLERQGRHAEAAAEWRRALALDPDNAKARTNLGIALAGDGRRAEALAEFRRAVELNPRYTEARNNLGVALVQAGDYDAAATQFRAALQSNPGSAEAQQNLGVALLQGGRTEEAIAHYRDLLAGSPRDAGLRHGLGNALLLGGRTAEALAQWRLCLEIEPRHVAALTQSAWLLATSPDASLRNGALAVRLAKRAVELSGERDPAILDTLAAAYAETGDFPAAVAAARRGLELAEQEELRARLALYEQKRAYRDGTKQ